MRWRPVPGSDLIVRASSREAHDSRHATPRSAEHRQKRWQLLRLPCKALMQDSEPRTVLVADDDRDVLNLIRLRLERDGLRVLVAVDGAAALELAREQRPDVCVLDVMMPKLGGLEVLRALRGDPATIATRVILLTARSADTEVDEGLRRGADDYVVKPFSPQELRRRVRAQLSRART